MALTADRMYYHGTSTACLMESLQVTTKFHKKLTNQTFSVKNQAFMKVTGNRPTPGKGRHFPAKITATCNYMALGRLVKNGENTTFSGFEYDSTPTSQLSDRLTRSLSLKKISCAQYRGGSNSVMKSFSSPELTSRSPIGHPCKIAIRKSPSIRTPQSVPSSIFA